MSFGLNSSLTVTNIKKQTKVEYLQLLNLTISMSHIMYEAIEISVFGHYETSAMSAQIVLQHSVSSCKSARIHLHFINLLCTFIHHNQWWILV